MRVAWCSVVVLMLTWSGCKGSAVVHVSRVVMAVDRVLGVVKR
jgi:hypothetical protein